MEDLCKDHNCFILYSNETGECDMEKLHFNCSNEYNRKPSPDLDYLIEENWTKFSKEIEILYNGEKFRVHSVELTPDNHVNVQLGLTCYKDYVGTNLSSRLDRFMEYGHKNYDDKQACLSDALGVGAIVITSDGYFLLVKRSQGVAEAKGMIDFPGGHAEPAEMAKRTKVEKIDLETVDGKDVLYEIFHSMVREVRDEINIPESSIRWPLLLGLLRNITNGGKPHASFLINCDLTKKQIEKLYSEGGPEAYESTGIFFIKKQDMINFSAEQLKNELGELTPCGKATLHLYFNHCKSIRNKEES